MIINYDCKFFTVQATNLKTIKRVSSSSNLKTYKLECLYVTCENFEPNLRFKERTLFEERALFDERTLFEEHDLFEERTLFEERFGRLLAYL